MKENSQPIDSEYADLLLITHEKISDKMAGPGIRAWEIAQALGQHGVNITLATPYESVRQATGVRIERYSWDEPQTLVNLIEGATVILTTGPLLARIVYAIDRPIEKPVIVDIYDVVEIERIMYHAVRGDQHHDPMPAILDEMYVYLRHGDYFICSSEKQHDLWVGALMAAGRINPISLKDHFQLDHLLGIVPMGMPLSPPQPTPPRLRNVVPGIDDDDKILFWGGGIWEWTDPFTLIEAMELLLKKRQDIRLVFGSLHHFDQDIVPEMTVANRFFSKIEDNGWLDRYVFFQDWVPYDERGGTLLEVDLGISLNLPTI